MVLWPSRQMCSGVATGAGASPELIRPGWKLREPLQKPLTLRLKSQLQAEEKVPLVMAVAKDQAYLSDALVTSWAGGLGCT